MRVAAQSKPKLLIETLRGERGDRPPVWYMRQAGRYLPEYRAIRARLGGFWELVFNPDMAAEVTLQPVRRFNLDAAILFSDILVVPFALGQKVEFVENMGPALEPLAFDRGDLGLDQKRMDEVMAPVFGTLRRVSKELAAEKTLIGFAGSPWTVATYMVEGKGTPEKAKAKAFFRNEREKGNFLIETLVEATVFYLDRQIEAGAETVQLFDSWAGALSGDELEALCFKPTREIVARVKARHPDIPVIGYPKGIGRQTKSYFTATGVDAIGIDHGLDPAWAAAHLQPQGCVQGNLDPGLLVKGGPEMLGAAGNILQAFANGPHVFNLGHGITPGTPVEHVAELSDFVRSWRA